MICGENEAWTSSLKSPCRTTVRLRGYLVSARGIELIAIVDNEVELREGGRATLNRKDAKTLEILYDLCVFSLRPLRLIFRLSLDTGASLF